MGLTREAIDLVFVEDPIVRAKAMWDPDTEHEDRKRITCKELRLVRSAATKGGRHHSRAPGGWTDGPRRTPRTARSEAVQSAVVPARFHGWPAGASLRSIFCGDCFGFIPAVAPVGGAGNHFLYTIGSSSLSIARSVGLILDPTASDSRHHGALPWNCSVATTSGVHYSVRLFVGPSVQLVLSGLPCQSFGTHHLHDSLFACPSGLSSSRPCLGESSGAADGAAAAQRDMEGGAWQSGVFDNGRDFQRGAAPAGGDPKATVPGVPAAMYNPPASSMGGKDGALMTILSLAFRSACILFSIVGFAIIASNEGSTDYNGDYVTLWKAINSSNLAYVLPPLDSINLCRHPALLTWPCISRLTFLASNQRRSFFLLLNVLQISSGDRCYSVCILDCATGAVHDEPLHWEACAGRGYHACLHHHLRPRPGRCCHSSLSCHGL